jgi:predicted glycosyltransferase
MTDKTGGARLLLYCHDPCGADDLRCFSAIADSLTGHPQDRSTLLILGSPIVGSVDLPDGMDFLRLPSVKRLPHGDFATLNLKIEIDDTLAIRESIIRHTAEMFAPDFFLVDRYPFGLCGEVRKTLSMLKPKKTQLVFRGQELASETDSHSQDPVPNHAIPFLRDRYDRIWICAASNRCCPTDAIRRSQIGCPSGAIWQVSPSGLKQGVPRRTSAGQGTGNGFRM